MKIDFKKEKPAKSGDYFVYLKNDLKRVFYWDSDPNYQCWRDSDSVRSGGLPLAPNWHLCSNPESIRQKWRGEQVYVDVVFWIKE